MSENENVIPAEAVEAALAANRAYKSQRSRDNAEKQMRAILEAAAPYIKSQLLEEVSDAVARELPVTAGRPRIRAWLRTRADSLRAAL